MALVRLMSSKISRTLPPAAFSATRRTVASRMLIALETGCSGFQPVGGRSFPFSGSHVPVAGGIDGLRLLESLLHPVRAVGLQFNQRLNDRAGKIDGELFWST